MNPRLLPTFTNAKKKAMIFSAKRISNTRSSAFKLVLMLLVLLSLALFNNSFAAVTITAPSLTVYPCTTFPTAYRTLGDIVITEGNSSDFQNSTVGATLILAVPANFEFQPGIGTVSYITSRDIDPTPTISVTATEITITYTTNGGSSTMDAITISGIKVRGITAATSSSLITRGGGTPAGGTAVINGAVVGGLTYGTLVSTPFPSANAGADQIVCATSATFQADPIFDPNITGTWTLVSGAGTITSPNSSTSGVTGLALGDNTFRWTTTWGTCTSNSIVTITSQSVGIGCTVATNNFSAVTAISPSYATQNITCPPPSTAPGITQFTLANPSPFNVGDKVLVIQMQGAIVDVTDAAVDIGGKDAIFGSVIDYNGAGNYEYAIIATKVGSVVTFSQNLVNKYNVAGKVQLVSVPQFANYTISTPMTGTPWDGTTGTGGVLVFEVLGTLTLNSSISMDSKGFLGGGNTKGPGAPLTGAAINFGVFDAGSGATGGRGVYSTGVVTPSTGIRGEGIAASSSHLYGRGALANGGGSGGGWNSGAGGGSNICPGGRGGYEFSSVYNSCGVNPKFTGCVPTYNTGNGYAAAGLSARMNGVGGYALSATATRVFMGGGGGAANGDGASATAGGNGGGIIIITANTIAGTSGTISANGQRGYANNIAPYTSTVDGTGGGGGGGSVILDVDTYTIGTLTVTAKGGKGGNQDQANTCHGNGGGGGGGLVRHKGITPNVVISTAGGNIGVQRPSPNTDPDTDASLPLSSDNSCAGGTTYGALPGGGDCGGSVQSLAQAVPQKGCCSPADLGPDQTLCGTASITLLNGTLSNTNKIFRWYKNGILIGGATGPTYTATSSGLYSVAVDSTVAGFTYCTVSDAMLITNAFPTPYLGPDQQLCSPSYLDLVPSNVGSFPASTTWVWKKDGVVISGATTPYLNNVTDAGTYTLTASAGAGCGPTSASITLTTVSPIVVGDCRGDAGTLTLSVSGGNGGPYEWYANETGGSALTTGTTYTTPSLSSTTTYWVQDNGLYQTTIGPPLTLTTNGTLTSVGNRAANSVDNQVMFDALQDFYLRGLTVQYWANSCGGSVSYSINISNSTTGYTTQTRSGTAGPCGSGLQTYTITFATPIFIPAGTNYRIDPTGSSHAFAWYPGSFTYPSTYSSIIKFNKNNSSDADAYPGYFDWQVSYPKICNRVPVIAAIDPSCAPQPVHYINFTAELQDNSVYLNWSTALEKDNDYFDVQRSLDGINFETIGRIKGNGTTLQTNRYHYTDLSVPASTVYYRLAQTDFDGEVSYSKVVVVNNDKSASVSLYPNPFNTETNLIVKSKFDYKITIRIKDLSGKDLHAAEYSTNQNILVGEYLPEGMYIVEISSEYETKTVKVIKMNE